MLAEIRRRPLPRLARQSMFIEGVDEFGANRLNISFDLVELLFGRRMPIYDLG